MTTDFSVREATPDDRDGVALLCVAALEFDARRNAEAYPEVLARRPIRQLVAVSADDEIVGTIIGSTQERDGELVGYVDLIAVSPGSRRNGIGRALLERLEAAHRDDGCAAILVMGHPPWYASPGVDVAYTPAIGLFERQGYENIGSGLNMTTELRGRGEMLDTTLDEERLAKEGIVVRRLEPFDEAGIRPWLETWGGSWADEALGSLRFDPVRCHIALKEGQWLGFAAWGINGPTVFGPMGTEESAREHGIGTVLLKRCLADQYVEEIDVAEIGWAGPYRFYARAVDARITRIFWFFRKQLTSSPGE